jgi:hypothetical protein
MSGNILGESGFFGLFGNSKRGTERGAGGRMGGGGTTGSFTDPTSLPPMTASAVEFTTRLPSDIQKGAETATQNTIPEINIVTVNENNPSDSAVIDQRAKIRVPNDYILMLTRGSKFGELYNAGGIIFPYSPTISLSHNATYSASTPTHSNYPIQFYKNSSIGDITINAVLTVQNETDAFVCLSIMHLLSALTKMRWGTDSDSGAPPPVCRLDAYGPYMLKNVPIVISEFRHDVPNDVDFYTLTSGKFGVTSVPTKQVIVIICKPVYSRQEMLSTSVTKYLSDPNTRKRGFI